MQIANIRATTSWFQVLQTTARSQTAVMTLSREGKSSEEMNVHEKSDQVLLVIEGDIQAEVGREKHLMRAGDVCIVPAGTPHRFQNAGRNRALAFSVYAPPEYPANEKG